MTMSERRIHKVFWGVLAFVALFWIVQMIQVLFDTDFEHFGIKPRDYPRLASIIFAPFIHNTWALLIANTAAILVLATILISSYPRTSKVVIPFIYFGSGLAVWIFASDNYHVGASNLTFGCMTVLFILGVVNRNMKQIGFACAVFFIYGFLVLTFTPTKAHISFESHIFSAFIGIVFAILFRNYEVKDEEPEYDWQNAKSDYYYEDDDNRWR